MQESPRGVNKSIIGIIVVVLLIIAATATIVLTGSDKQQGDETPVVKTDNAPGVTNDTQSPTSTDTKKTTKDNFKDGTYSATGRYQTPGGIEAIDVSVTLKDDVIANASVVSKAISNEAKEHQELFLSGYKSQVEGKRIDEISLSRVSGSSLTPIGFNSAIDDIENQARI